MPILPFKIRGGTLLVDLQEIVMPDFPNFLMSGLAGGTKLLMFSTIPSMLGFHSIPNKMQID